MSDSASIPGNRRWMSARIGLGVATVLFSAVQLAVSTSSRPTTAQGSEPLGCDGNNPRFAVALNHGSRNLGEPAVISLNDTLANRLADRVPVVDSKDVGSIHGLAYDPHDNHLFAAAFVHVDGGFGPGGPGAIYRIDLNTQAVTTWSTIRSAPRDLDPEDRATILPRIGQVGIGDIELDPHADLLFVSDLTDQRIRVVSTGSRVELVSFPHGASQEPWAANARIFGLAVHDGYVYHGLVDSRLDPSLDGELQAVIYRSRYDGSEMKLAAAIPLDYRTEPVWRTWQEYTRSIRHSELEAQALVGDIGFTATGDMVVALRDRGVDLSWGGHGRGDLLLLRGSGEEQWQQENIEHFNDDTFGHAEPLYGTLAMNKGRLSVVATSARPFELLDGVPYNTGLRWFSTREGVQRGVVDAREPARDDEFMVLGDVELLCDPGGPTPVASFTPPIPPSPTDRPATGTTTATVTVTTAPSSTPPSPTSTPSATLARPTASPSQPITPSPVYLPLLDKASCTTKPLSVILILDLSTSMDSFLDSGERRVDAALDAAGLLAADLEARGEPIAIVAFHDEAWIEQDFATTPGSSRSALLRLRGKLAEGTRFDLALIEARRLVADRDPTTDAIEAAILLTDGQPNRVPPAADGRPETTILEAAGALRAEGLQLIAVGFGPRNEYNEALLCALGNRCHVEVDGLALRKLYRALPDAIRCAVR